MNYMMENVNIFTSVHYYIDCNTYELDGFEIETEQSILIDPQMRMDTNSNGYIDFYDINGSVNFPIIDSSSIAPIF